MIYKTLKKVSNYCQLVDKRKFPETTTTNGITFTNNGDGTITANGTATAKRSFFICSSSTIKGHKYLLSGCPEGGGYYNFSLETSWGNDYGSGNIMTFTRDLTSGNCYITVNKDFVCSNLTFKPQLFDLTEMYGAGNEPTTVEQFRQDFPEELYDYKPYCFVKSYKSIMICKTKNLFPTSTVVGTLSGFANTIPRQFEEDKWYIGMTRNNYYEPINIADYELTGNYIYVNVKNAWYGIAKAFKCKPNQTYTISCKWIKHTALMYIGIGFYDENGNYLSETVSSGLGERFTTPANCKWFTVCFISSTNNGSSYVYNIQLEEGSTHTEFVPNGYLQSYKKSLFCKTKNLFDIDKVFSAPTLCFDVSSLEIGKTYTFSSNKPILVFKISNMRGGYNSVWNYPQASSGFTTFTFVMARDEHIPVNEKQYLFLWLPELNTTGDINTSGYVTDISQLDGYNLQIELGDTATEYHPYGYL